MHKIVIELVDANVPPKVWIEGVEVDVNRLSYLVEIDDLVVGEPGTYELNIGLSNGENVGYAFIK